MPQDKKCAVFILLGQSNAVGHGIPMKEEDRVTVPMKNVFGLSREANQSFDTDRLVWSGYTSGGMNLAETQDHTYSVANCLAARWQAEIDRGNPSDLPDLYILHIAIGAQGVTRRYLWHPETERVLIPGELGKVKISLFSFSEHIFSLLDRSFAEMGREYEVLGLHWRGGENDIYAPMDTLAEELAAIYTTIFGRFSELLHTPPIVLHRLVCTDRMHDLDPTGEEQFFEKMQIINAEFDRLAACHANVSVFDTTCAPQYREDVRGNGLFIEDNVHFTPEVNDFVAEKILSDFVKNRK